MTSVIIKPPKLQLPKVSKDQIITVDLETCDPDLKTKAPGWVHGNGHICGVCLATRDSEYYLPVGHEEGENLDMDLTLEWLQDLMNWKRHEVVFHNAHYDWGWLKYYNLDIKRQVVDTMLAAPLLDEERFSYSLDSLAKAYLPNSKGKDEEILERAIRAKFEYDWEDEIEKVKLYNKVTGKTVHQELANFEKRPDRDNFDIMQQYSAPKKKHFTIKKKDMKSYLWRLRPEQVAVYGKQDARLTHNLWTIFKPMLKAQGLVPVFEMECQLIPALIEMRKKGVRIDLNRAEELKTKYTAIIEEQQSLLDTLVGHKLSITNEGDSLVKACDRLGIPYGRTAEGNPSFAEENMPKGYDHFYLPLLKARKYTKARDVFLTSYLSYCIGDRVHPQFNQLKSDDGGTVTGRFSCTSPNVQNIPARDPEIGPELRSIFIPEDGEEWLTLDYSAQEPRMLVHLAIMMAHSVKDGLKRCPSAQIAMEERFCGRDSDFHTEVAKAVINSQYVPVIDRTSDDDLEAYYNASIANLPWVHSDIDGMLNSFKKDAQEYYEEHLIGTYINFEHYYESKPIEERTFNRKTLVKFLYKKFRKPAKAIGLGVMYGRGVPSIVEGLRMDKIILTIEEAQQIKDAVIRAVPFLDMVNRFFETMAKQKGYVTTLLGRRGRFPKFEVLDFSDWRDDSIKNKERKTHLFNTLREAGDFYQKNSQTNDSLKPPQRANTYKALNKVIQGSSADQTKTAILQFYKAGKIDKMRMTVHDEISFSIIPGVDDPHWFQEVMENCLDLYCASKCDPSTGRNWNEAK